MSAPATIDPDEAFERRALVATPLLGILASLAALADLATNRVAVRSLIGTLSHPDLVRLSRWGELPRNLAAVCGLVALTLALLAFLRTPAYAPVRRRLSIAGFAGIFLPTTALATLLPAERTSLQIVLFATGAANVLVILLGLTAARRSAPWGVRGGVLMLSLSALLAFTALAFALIEPLAHVPWSATASSLLRRAGEVLWILTPLAVGISVFPRDRTVRSRVAAGVGALVFFAAAALMWWGQRELRGDFPIVLYGATRVELLLEALPAAYIPFLAATLGIGFGALASGDATARQAGAALLLLLAAGYAARSPSRLLMTVLAMALLARVCIALGDRIAEARARPEPVSDRAADSPAEVDPRAADRAE